MPFPGTVQLPLQFSGGINSKVDNFTLDQPNLQSFNNGIYNVLGRIDKRTGLTAISNNIQDGGSIAQGLAVTTFHNELIQFDGSSIYSWQPEAQNWVSKGSVFSTINSQYRILNSKVAQQNNPDATSSNNVSLYAWEDTRVYPAGNNGIRYSVYNTETDSFVVSDQLANAGGARPKVVTNNTDFYLLYSASSQFILYDVIPIANPSIISSPNNIITSDGYSSVPGVASIAYDACIFNGELLVVYATPTGVVLTMGDGFTITNGNPAIVVSVCVDSFNHVWVAQNDGYNTYISSFTYTAPHWNPVFSTITLVNSAQPQPVVNLAIIEDVNLGALNVTCEMTQSQNYTYNLANGTADGYYNYLNNYTVQNNGTVSFIGQQRGLGLYSKPFNYNRNIFVNTIRPTSLQSTYITLCLSKPIGFLIGTGSGPSGQNSQSASGFSVISKHNPQNAGTYRNNNILCQCDTFGTGQFLFAGQRKGAFTSFQNANTAILGVAGFTIDFESENAFNNVTSNNNLHIVGGIKKIYDGVSCVEDNFHFFPELPDGYGCDITLISGGNLTYNALTAPNLYQYVIVYEWSDNFGQVQRSGVSVANSVFTTIVGQGAQLVFPTLPITEKVNPRAGISIAIYRTQDNLPVFYKITDDNDPIINDSTVDFMTFTDTLSDLDIAANENLYTGSQLSNTAPPACSLISLYQNRLFINQNEDPDVLWYSQNKFEQDQYNTLSLDWNTTFTEGINDRYGGIITAVGLLDNNLAIFKESSIFILQGDGPNALATSGQFNDAYLLVADTGCNNPDSLCFITQTPNLPGGLLFKSNKGIYLLGRDTSITYIGSDVAQYNDYTITSANLLALTNQVVFTTLEGTCLVYNYYFNSWSTWGPNLPAVDACIWQDQFCILQSNGTVMIQDNTNTIYQDTFDVSSSPETSPISMSLVTPWIKFQGNIQNYMSVYNCLLMGIFQGPHILEIGVAYDGNPANIANVQINSSVCSNQWGSNPIWGSNGIWGDSSFANYQFMINFTKPRCQAIQLTISDLTNDGYGQYPQNIYNAAYSLTGLSFEVLPHAGGMRLPTSRVVGAKNSQNFTPGKGNY